MRTLLLTLCLHGAALAAPPPPPPPPDAPSLSDVQAREADLLRRVAAFDAERHAELLRLKREQPDAYWRALGRVAAFSDRLGRHEPSPEEVALHGRLEAVRARHGDNLLALPAKEQAAVRAELTAIATDIFAARQAERRRRIDELQQALAHLQADVARRDTDRDALLQQFVDAFMAGRPDL